MVTPGKVIEYVEHGKFICAAVLEINGKRLRLINQHGREVNLPQARVVHCSVEAPVKNSSRQMIEDILTETARVRREIELPVPLEEVWELACDSNETALSCRFLTELCFGDNPTDNHEAAFLRTIFKDRLFFKYKNGKIFIHSPEVVNQLKAKEEEEKKRELLLEQGAKGISMIMEGKNLENWPDRGYCLHIIGQYYLFNREAEEFDTAKQILKRAGLTAPHDPFRLMVKTGIWDKNENIPLLRQQIPVEFTPEENKAAQAISEPPAAELCQDGRLDLRHLPLITIDGKGTKDFDDAIHIEKKGDNFLVGIHITDVAHYIRPRTTLFELATTRTTSLYFPDATIPMLPKDLSENILSLKEGAERPAVSFMVELSPQGKIISSKIVRSVVQVKRQLNYQDAEQVFQNDEELSALVQLSRALQKNRLQAGALIIPIPDVSIHIDADDNVSVKLLSVESNMRVLVSEFMVLANSIGAEYIALRQYPGLFRSQKPPQKRLFQEPQDDLYLNFRQRRHLARGLLSTVAKRHSGVGVEQYTTLTSPIRRLLDLVMQLQLTEILKGNGPLFSIKDLNGVAQDIALAASKCNLVRQRRHRYWLLKYLEPRQGGAVSAFILARNSNRVRVVLKDILLDGELPPTQGNNHGPGDNIMVKIAKVSPLDNILRLDWC